jgi:hypothetical protein
MFHERCLPPLDQKREKCSLPATIEFVEGPDHCCRRTTSQVKRKTGLDQAIMITSRLCVLPGEVL